jgi:hypothetical protein
LTFLHGRDGDDGSATLHVFVDNDQDSKWIIENVPPTTTTTTKQDTTASRRSSLHHSRKMAAMLYESLSELLHSHRDLGPLSISADRMREKILAGSEDSLQVRKEKLSNLLSEGLRDLDEFENRSGACFPVMGAGGPLSFSKQAVLLKQKDQLVNMLSTVLTQIEELEAEEAESRNSKCETRSSGNPNTSLTLTGSKRRTSFHSDVSSITSRTTISVPRVEPVTDKREALFHLPCSLRSGGTYANRTGSDSKPKLKSSKPKPKPKAKSSKAPKDKKKVSSSFSIPKPATQLECDINSTLQDSFASLCSVGAEDKSPQRPQRRMSLGARVDSVLCFEPEARCEVETGAAAEGTQASAQIASTSGAIRQPPRVTQSCDDGGAANPRLLQRPGGKKTKGDTRVRIPQRKRSFEDPSFCK